MHKHQEAMMSVLKDHFLTSLELLNYQFERESDQLASRVLICMNT